MEIKPDIKLSDAVLIRTFWTGRDDAFVVTDKGIFCLPELRIVANATCPQDDESGIVVNKRIAQIRHNGENGLFFLFTDGSVLIYELRYDPSSYSVYRAIDIQSANEAQQWRDEFDGYERLC